MLILCCCLASSNTLTAERKKLFCMLFSVIIVSALCEWLGVLLDGKNPATRGLHIAVKAIELSVAPSIAFLFSWVIEPKWKKRISCYLAVHSIIECLSGIFGFIYYVDENNFYHHGTFYWIYIASYFVSILFSLFIVARNLKKYQYNGLSFFLATTLLMCTGIVIQLCDSSLKVDYVTLGITSTMLYVFTLEMIQQTDELTGLLNRRGFENYVAHINEECIVLFFDVDRFKSINDTYGHAFGDTVLKETSAAVKKYYGKYGKCFRYGGDEFCVFINRNIPEIEHVNQEFLSAVALLQKEEPRIPTVSLGHAAFDPAKQDIQDVIEASDHLMYECKAARKAESSEI